MSHDNQDDTKTGASTLDEQPDITASTIRFPTELWKRAKILAVMHDRAASDMVIEGLRRLVEVLESEREAT